MPDEALAPLVLLACHDLRTPLATVNGIAKTLIRADALGDREARFLAMIDEAAGEMSGLLEQLGLAARIAAGRYEPAALQADTLELATSGDERIGAVGQGAAVQTDVDAVRASLESLALAAMRFGPATSATWTVAARELVLAPLTADAALVVSGESPRDLGSLVARTVIEHLGGTLGVEGETLHVVL